MPTYRATFKAFALFCIICTAIAANAACERHIYNTSHKPWTFMFIPSLGTGENVWYSGAVCNGQINGSCTIPAGVSLMITYTTNNGNASGTVGIQDSTGKVNFWTYSGTLSQCPYVSHNGSTGSVGLNDSANGDFTAGGDIW
jgi:hypothetical protein